MSVIGGLGDPINPDNPGFGPAIVGVTWTLTAIAIIVVALRFYLRRKMARSWDPEDWIMLVTLVLQVAFEACLTVSCNSGLGMSLRNMTVEELSLSTKWVWISSPFSNMVSILARISIAMLLIRIFGSVRWLKTSLIIFTALQAVLGILNIIFIWSQCHPVEGLWDFGVKKRCWNQKIQQTTAMVLQFCFAFSDLTYVLFPVMIVWRLQMALRRKIALIVLMAMSLITMAAALSKAVINVVYFDANFSSQGADSFRAFGLQILCTGIEQALVIIMGCTPALRSITKLEVPSITTAIGSLVSLIARTDISRTDGSQTSSRYYNMYRQSGDNELNLRSDFASDEEWALNRPVTSSTSQSGPDYSKYVKRTDDYTVTYENRPQSEGNTGKR